MSDFIREAYEARSRLLWPEPQPVAEEAAPPHSGFDGGPQAPSIPDAEDMNAAIRRRALGG